MSVPSPLYNKGSKSFIKWNLRQRGKKKSLEMWPHKTTRQHCPLVSNIGTASHPRTEPWCLETEVSGLVECVFTRSLITNWIPHKELLNFHNQDSTRSSNSHPFLRLAGRVHRAAVKAFTFLSVYSIIHVYVCVCMCAQPCLTVLDPMERSPPGFSVHGISQARIRSGLPFPPPGDNPEMEPASPVLQADSLPMSHLRSP